MSVKPQDLENPERDLELTTREGEKLVAELQAVQALQVLRERIATANATTPRDPIPHCGDCYRRGWRSALRAIDG